MKKKLAYILVIISVTVLALYLFRYKQALIYEKKIPISATEIVQINLREIEHHLLIDVIKNPLKYISFKSKKKGSISFNKTIEIPKNLFFFTNNSNYKNAWFSSLLKLKDSHKLKRYLLQEGFKNSTSNKLETFCKGRIIIAFSSSNAIIALKKQENTSIISEIKTVFNQTTFYKKESELLKSISNSKSDITYTNLKDDFLEANFKNGLFEIKGSLNSNLFIADKYVEDTNNSIGFISTKINKNNTVFKSLSSLKNKKKFKNFTKLSLDSIVNKWNGSLVANLRAIDTKIDTIVTYKYDDDFNKIEKKSIQKFNTPNISISLGSNKNLYEYFYNSKAIQIIENDTLLTSIPIYKMYAKQVENTLNIYSQKNENTSEFKKEEYKFNMFIAVSRYLKQPLEFSSEKSINKYLQLIKNVSAKQTLNNKVVIQVRLKEEKRNCLGQFLKP